MTKQQSGQVFSHQGKQKNYQVLLPRYIQMIDAALSSIGDYGEVRIIVDKGRLRFLIIQKSYDILKLQPGILVNNSDNDG